MKLKQIAWDPVCVLQISPDGNEVLVAVGLFHTGRERSGRADRGAEVDSFCQIRALELVLLVEAGAFASPCNAVLWKRILSQFGLKTIL